jgi:hypothetical protein
MTMIKLRRSPQPPKRNPKPPREEHFIEHPVVAGTISGIVSGVFVVAITPLIPAWGIWFSQNSTVALALFVGVTVGVLMGSRIKRGKS